MELDDDKKKVLVVIMGIVFVILSIAGIYFVFFYSSDSNNVGSVDVGQPTEQTGGTGGLPNIGLSGSDSVSPETTSGQPTDTQATEGLAPVTGTDQKKASPFVESSVTALTTKAGTGARYYQPSTGFFYKRLSDGKSIPLSDRQFNNVQKITWSKKDSALMEFPDGANIVYDFAKQQQYTLPSELKEFAFNEQSDTLSAKVYGPLIEDNWLVTINSDGSNLSYVESMGNNGSKVQTLWSPNGMVAAIFADNNGSDSNKIVPIGLHGENYPSFNTTGRGFKGAWADDGKKMLFTTYSSQIDFRNTLWIAEFNDDLSVKRQVNLGLSTFLDKCYVGNDRAYCAVPQSMPEGGGWFPELTKDVPDDIYYINFKTLEVTKLMTPVINDANATISTVQYDSVGNQLLLSDSKTGEVFSVNLTK